MGLEETWWQGATAHVSAVQHRGGATSNGDNRHSSMTKADAKGAAATLNAAEVAEAILMAIGRLQYHWLPGPPTLPGFLLCHPAPRAAVSLLGMSKSVVQSPLNMTVICVLSLC
jgi:hypothetical protein